MRRPKYLKGSLWLRWQLWVIYEVGSKPRIDNNKTKTHGLTETAKKQAKTTTKKWQKFTPTCQTLDSSFNYKSQEFPHFFQDKW